MRRRMFGPPPGIGDTIVHVAHGRAARLKYGRGLFGLVMGAAFGRQHGALEGSVSSVLSGRGPLDASPVFGGHPRRLSMRRFVRLAGRIRTTLGGGASVICDGSVTQGKAGGGRWRLFVVLARR